MAYETFYLRASGNGSAPKTVGGAYDAADFNTAGNWTASDAEDDNLIGPGDTVIVLDDDGPIRATLTVQQSGLAGKPITIRGENAAVTVSGADVISSWTDEAVGGGETVEASPAVNADDAHMWAGGWWGTEAYFKMGENAGKVSGHSRIALNVPQGATITTATVAFQAKENKAAGAVVNIMAHDVDDSAQITSGSAFETAQATVTTASVQWTIGATTQDVTYTTPDIKTVVQEIVDRGGWAANQHIHLFFMADASATSAGSFKARDNVTGYPVLSVTYDSGAGATVYYGTLAADPNQVFEDGVRLTEVGTKAALGDGVGRWWWDSDNTRVYVRLTGDDAPTGHTITASVRNDGVASNAKGYFTVTTLTLKETKWAGVNVSGGNGVVGITVSNCTLTNNYLYGTQFYSAAGTQGGTVSGCTVTYNGDDGIQISRNSSGVTVSNNVVHHNCVLDIENWEAGIKVIGSADPKPTNVTVEGNTVYLNGDDTDQYRGFGIWADTPGTGVVVRRNLAYSNSMGGIFLENGNASEVYYNISHSHTAKWGFLITASGTEIADGNLIYNNVAYGNNVGIECDGKDSAGSFVNNVLKNNISDGNTTEFKVWGGAENDGTNGSGNVYTYNCFGAEASNFIEWPAGTGKSTYDAWETAYGGTTNSVEADPLFVSASDFHLQAGSPCINAGVDVGLAQDYDGRPVERTPDVGAYERHVGWIDPTVKP